MVTFSLSFGLPPAIMADGVPHFPPPPAPAAPAPEPAVPVEPAVPPAPVAEQEVHVDN